MKRLISFYKRKKRMLANFKTASPYLSTGEYLFDDALQCIYKEEPDTIQKLNKDLKNTKSKSRYHQVKKTIKNLLFYQSIDITNSKAINDFGFKGTIYLATHDETNDAKIFDFSNRLVLTIYSSKSNMNKKITAYNLYKKSFQIPEIKYIDEQNNIILEKLIEIIPEEDWKEEDYEQLISYVFSSYKSYSNNCESQASFTMQRPWNLMTSKRDKAKIIDLLKLDRTDELINSEFPLLKIHGDLWSANVLLTATEKPDYYLIDWEYADEYLFFYDIFWLMKDEAFSNNNFYYIDNYFNGKYDQDFKELFAIFGIEFNGGSKLTYIKLFYINVFQKRGGNSQENKELYKEYSYLIEQLKLKNLI